MKGFWASRRGLCSTGLFAAFAIGAAAAAPVPTEVETPTVALKGTTTFSVTVSAASCVSEIARLGDMIRWWVALQREPEPASTDLTSDLGYKHVLILRVWYKNIQSSIIVHT